MSRISLIPADLRRTTHLRRKTMFALLACFALTGCTGYEPPTANYTYVTSTQDYHDLGGLRIQCTVTDGLLTAVVGSAVGLREYQAFYVDGRQVFVTNGVKSGETFVQLPPGNHELLVTEKMKGSATLGGAADVGGRSRVRFTLARGATATVQTTNWAITSFEGADFEVLDGQQILGLTAVTPSHANRPAEVSLEDKLKRLKELHAKGLVSDETYQERMAELVATLK